MKKLIILTALPFLLTGCTNDSEVHNGLVEAANKVAIEESEFYDVYFELKDQETTEELQKEFQEFKAAAAELDMFYTTNDFSAKYEPYVAVYDASLKPALADYILTGEEFITKSGDIFNYDEMKPMFAMLDELARNYQTADNLLTEEIQKNATAPVVSE